MVRTKTADEATFKDDVLWADAVIVGTPVYNGNVAGAMKLWLETWDYVGPKEVVGLEDKIGSVFATGGHIFGGIESTLKAVAAQFHIFGMRVMTAEADYQPKFPFGVGAPTGDPQFNNTDPGPGAVDAIFLDAGKALGCRIAGKAAQLKQERAYARAGRTMAEVASGGDTITAQIQALEAKLTQLRAQQR